MPIMTSKIYTATFDADMEAETGENTRDAIEIVKTVMDKVAEMGMDLSDSEVEIRDGRCKFRFETVTEYRHNVEDQRSLLDEAADMVQTHPGDETNYYYETSTEEVEEEEEDGTDE